MGKQTIATLRQAQPVEAQGEQPWLDPQERRSNQCQNIAVLQYSNFPMLRYMHNHACRAHHCTPVIG